MDKDKLQEFTRRVAQASRSELIVIMYDVILADTKAAREALKENDISCYEKELKHAARFLNELMGTLDYQYTISHDLLSLYSYVNRRIIGARMKKDVSLLADADKVLLGLREAFAAVSAQDVSGPMMRNAEQVYVGLTYGKGSLNEALLDPNGAKRGFMA